MKLYTYFRSGAAWRVRIGLAWKGLAFQSVAINLRTGEQSAPGWQARNPQAMVPALELDDGTFLTQSLAILEWLEETHPNPAFLPDDPIARARIRAIVLSIAADTHPIQNLGVLKRIETLLGADAARQWGHNTLVRGLSATEALVAGNRGPFAFGSNPTLADIVIVPQLLNCRRFAVDMALFPRLGAIEAACAELPAFKAAHPDLQQDAE
ncbi:MAG: maleylacetoacetate isomerase [Sandaracinobacteroides sp.]